MDNLSNKLLWAKLVSVDPYKENIHLITKPDQPNQHQVDGEWKIYQDAAGETRIVCLSASCIKVDDVWLGMNQEKKLTGGERIAFSEDKTRVDNFFDYIFCLVSTEPAKKLKRIRDDSQEESTSISTSSQENQKLIKIEGDLVQELICSLCMETIDKCATLNPCQHSFCSQCLWDYLKTSIKCPLCAVKAVSVIKNCTLESILQLARNNFPHLQKSQDVGIHHNTGLAGSIVKEKFGFYVGSYLKGKKEGQGRFESRYGSLYEGGWRNDKKEGEGVEILKNGARYEGHWKKNLYHGFGKYTSADGSEYEGNWVQGMKQGHGTMKFHNGNLYQGEWKNDKREGKGTLLEENGSKYEGYWKENTFNGVGKYVWKTGEEYEGNWLNGHRYGKGTLKYVDGRLYSGHWKKKKHGEGILRLKNGDTLEGKWVKNVLQPVVKIEYSNGDRYEGEIKPQNFKKHGKGILTFLNGNQYHGHWVYDEFIDADGETSNIREAKGWLSKGRKE